MLVRFAQWIMTDTWASPLGLASKGGSPRKGGGSPQHIGNQGRLMVHAYELTKDPFFLAVPSRLTVAGFGAGSKPIFGTRSTGLVYNYLPWLLATLHQEGNPGPEPQLEITAPGELSALAPGAKQIVTVKLKNAGAQPVENLRMSLHSRRDVGVTAVRAAPSRIGPGETVECQYEITAPAEVNLSCDYNRVVWAQWSALYRRSDHAHLAHQPIKVVLASAGGEARAAGQ
jgi:hypothetical protein